MRKLIVCNFVTVDGSYESRDETVDGLFEHRHPDYACDDGFDHCATERLRAADTLVRSGRTSFLGNKADGTKVRGGPTATPIRRELPSLIERVDKLVVSDKVRYEDLAPWTHSRIVRVADAPREIASLERHSGRPAFSLKLNHTRQWQGSGNTLACYRLTAVRKEP